MTTTDDGQRPWWTLPEAASTKLWVEDDATCSQADHECVEAACRRLCGPVVLADCPSWDDGESTYYRLRGDVVVVITYGMPGESEIRQLWPRLSEAVGRELEVARLESQVSTLEKVSNFARGFASGACDVLAWASAEVAARGAELRRLKPPQGTCAGGGGS